MKLINKANVEIIYVQDALCGWCYGFSPVIEQIRKHYGGILSIAPVHGGLWPGTKARKMDQSLVAHLQAGMPQVTAVTGQVFGVEFQKRIVDNTHFIYDTEPAARAAIVVRACSPEYELEFIKDIQIDFFLNGQDPTQAETFIPIVNKYGIERDEFMSRYHSNQAIMDTQRDFARSASWGVTVFPTLLFRANGKISKISSGSCTASHVINFVDLALEANK